MDLCMIHRALRRFLTLLFDIGLLAYWFPFRKLIQKMPLNWILIVTDWIGRSAVLLLWGLRKRLEANISIWFSGMYSEKETRDIAKRSIYNYTGRRIEDLYFGTITKEMMEEIAIICGRENLEESVSRGKGTIILLSHFGSFLMALPALGYMGYKINQLAGPPTLKNHRPIHEKIFKVREKDYSNLPIKFLRTDLHIKLVIKALKNNELVAIAFDGREGNKWIGVNFLGKKALFSPGPLKFAMVTGATIVPTFVIRQKNNTHKLVFERPFEFEAAGTGEESLAANMQKMTGIFEDYIRKYPCHFVMIMQLIKERAKKGIITQDIT